MYPACHLVPEANGEQRRIEDVEAGSTLLGRSAANFRSPDAARLLYRPPSKADNFLKWCPTVKGVVCQPEFW